MRRFEREDNEADYEKACQRIRESTKYAPSPCRRVDCIACSPKHERRASSSIAIMMCLSVPLSIVSRQEELQLHFESVLALLEKIQLSYRTFHSKSCFSADKVCMCSFISALPTDTMAMGIE